MEEKKKFKEKLKDVYRISIVDVEDLKEVGKYQFSMRRLYTYIISAVLLLTFFVVSVIAFTPLKRLMPGYGEIEENRKFLELRSKIDVLEDELETQITYTQGLQNMLAGNGPSAALPSSSTVEKEVDNIDPQAVLITKEDVVESGITQALNKQYFVPPVLGSISADFDKSIGHFGTDILAAKGTAIKSITAGVVVGSSFTMDTGNTITIQHPNNVISIYKHNSALLKKEGDHVNAGEAIAIIGNTGTLSDGPHLHFELWYDGVPVNPKNFITFK